MLYKINNSIVDTDMSHFYNKGDSRTRGSQRLFQARITHPVLFNSFFSADSAGTAHHPGLLTPSLEAFQAVLGQWNSAPPRLTDTFIGGLPSCPGSVHWLSPPALIQKQPSVHSFEQRTTQAY
eukprot:TRINITY_DN13098_c0_g1_i5.p1 TRINITY_DN13098_c0_g1~~TRINITY_DN13098_c0_g1_i5.p1  ORF type:complete len:123 (-),score=23.44 TRINITY_DN13098_c0_g1_i5:28-396(-)